MPLYRGERRDVQELDKESPVIELRQHRNGLLVIHLRQVVEELQCERKEEQGAVPLAQDLVDLRDKSLPVQRLQQRLNRHLLDFVDLAHANNAKVCVVLLFSLAVLHESPANLVEELKRGNLDAVELKVL